MVGDDCDGLNNAIETLVEMDWINLEDGTCFIMDAKVQSGLYIMLMGSALLYLENKLVDVLSLAVYAEPVSSGVKEQDDEKLESDSMEPLTCRCWEILHNFIADSVADSKDVQVDIESSTCASEASSVSSFSDPSSLPHNPTKLESPPPVPLAGDIVAV